MTAGSMTGYVLARLAQLLPIVFVIVVVNFFLIRLAPGDPIAYIIGDAAVSPESVAELRSKLGLDDSLLRQLLIYLANVAQGDFGYSYVSRQPVIEVILARLPATLLLRSHNMFWRSPPASCWGSYPPAGRAVVRCMASGFSEIPRVDRLAT
jgi:ABC-type dipeptide/oligopeptide/nickel transport system permease component